MHILDADIYVVVYAVDEEASFKIAKSIFKKLQEIRRSNDQLRLLYLVGNKTDLVRSRQVATQSKSTISCPLGLQIVYLYLALNLTKVQ